MSDRVTFPLTIRVFTRKETAETWIIRSQEWFDEEERRQVDALSLKLDVSLNNDPAFRSLDDAAKSEVRNRPIESLKLTFADVRAKHLAAWDEAKEQTFTLIKPTHKELTAARNKVKHVDERSGDVRHDNAEMLELLLPGHVEDEDGQPVRVDSMTCEAVLDEIKSALWLSIRTAEERLPFSSTRS